MKGCVNCDWEEMSDKDKAEIANAIRDSLVKMGKNPENICIPGAENLLDFAPNDAYSKEVEFN